MGAMTRQTFREDCATVLDRVRAVVADSAHAEQALHDIVRVLTDAGYVTSPPNVATYQKPLG